MNNSYLAVLSKNFLGSSPAWYKYAIIICLIINPIIYFWVNPFWAGWLLVTEFIFTLAMALKCYPLQPGGLLAFEAIAIGMTDSAHVKQEVIANFEVILLLIFMVAGIYFMKQLLLYLFTKLLVRIRSKIVLSLAFCIAAAFLSAFLDALTVIAVVISVGVGFYSIYYKVAANLQDDDNCDLSRDDLITDKEELEQFRAFLRSLLMHAAVGTALGGVMTMVGEPQNLIIAKYANWDFARFFLHMIPITLPVLLCGLATCIVVERFSLFGYGASLPDTIRSTLSDYDRTMSAQRSKKEKLELVFQLIIAIWLVTALALHLAEVGLIGLSVIILVTSLCGITEEHDLGKAFQEALPFTALITVFFAVVAVIIDQKLFTPIINMVLQAEPNAQLSMFYLFNGLLSAVSDNVFVATIYINEARNALDTGVISPAQYHMIAIAINTGTNLPSVATPNGQAAFLFLLTSALAPLLRLSYGRMVIMALPYTIVLTLVGLGCVEYLLYPITDLFYQWGILPPPAPLPAL